MIFPFTSEWKYRTNRERIEVGGAYYNYLGGKIGKITSDDSVTEYAVGGFPYDIVNGPDGNLWFGEVNGNKIGKLTPCP